MGVEYDAEYARLSMLLTCLDRLDDSENALKGGQQLIRRSVDTMTDRSQYVHLNGLLPL